jgi:glutathione S-transferase
MAKIALTYFDIPGRAEPIRLALLIGGIPFEEQLVPFAEWGNICNDRSRFPEGTVPTLQVGDDVFGNSHAAGAYAAAAAGLDAPSPALKARQREILALIEAVYDGSDMTSFSRTMRCQDEDQKKVLRGEWTETLKFYLGRAESIAVGPLSAGDQLTYADLNIYNAIAHLKSKDIDYFDDSWVDQALPKLVAIYTHVSNLPAVKARRESGKGYQ